MQNVFPKLSGTPGKVRWPGPGLGQHNDKIFKELLDYDQSELDALLAEGII